MLYIKPFLGNDEENCLYFCVLGVQCLKVDSNAQSIAISASMDTVARIWVIRTVNVGENKQCSAIWKSEATATKLLMHYIDGVTALLESNRRALPGHGHQSGQYHSWYQGSRCVPLSLVTPSWRLPRCLASLYSCTCPTSITASIPGWCTLSSWKLLFLPFFLRTYHEIKIAVTVIIPFWGTRCKGCWWPPSP